MKQYEKTKKIDRSLSQSFRYNKLDFTKSFFACAIKVNGQIYLSLSHAVFKRISNTFSSKMFR